MSDRAKEVLERVAKRACEWVAEDDMAGMSTDTRWYARALVTELGITDE